MQPSFSMFERLKTGLALVDARGSIVWANAAFKSFFTHDIVEGSQFTQFVQKQSVDILLSSYSDLVSSITDHFEMVWPLLYHNTEYWFRGNFGRHIQEGSEDQVFLAEIENISALMDEKEKLEREKNIAEQATHSKSVFLANMSHEIRTPIHTITGMTELLSDTDLDDEQKEYVAQTKYAAEVLLTLINDILDFSKIEAGKFPIEKIDFNLVENLESAIEMQALGAFKKGLELVVDIDPSLPFVVEGDPLRLRQIITNLVANAIKFTQHGQVRVRCKAKKDEQGEYYFYGEVADTGIGIPEDKLSTLFQAFSQVDTSTTRRFGGTGLGLSICYLLAQLLGGTIGVRSIENRGSVFWFTLHLPIKKASNPDDFNRNILKDKRILIVDDNADTRRSTRAMIEYYGGTVFEAEHGAMALSILRSAIKTKLFFDIALIDLDMGVMDGWRFASEVNSDKEINELRMIMASPPGFMAGDAKMKLLNWIDGYVDKPFKKRDLISSLARALETNIDLDSTEDEAEVIEPLSFNLFTKKEPAKPVTETSTKRDQVKVELKQERVLVAEDHFVNQKLFSSILGRLGYVSVLASDGEEAYNKSLSEKPDLIFMDVQMPKMNGYEATIKLRKAGLRTPIIAVTANAIKGDVEKCLSAGMDDYVSKPFTKNDIEGMLHKWLGKESHTNKIDVFEQEPVFLYQEALDVFMGDKEVLESVLDEFTAKMPDQFTEIERAYLSGDFDQGRIIAHTLKGSSLNLGIIRFGRVAEVFELGFASKNIEDFRAKFEVLKAAWADFTAARADL